MITVLVRVVKASRMIVILTASHDDRFHSTPAETPRTQTQALRQNRHANPPVSGIKPSREETSVQATEDSMVGRGN